MRRLFDRYKPEARFWRVLRDKWVTLRSIQHCDGCRMELPHYELARLRVYAGPGEFVTGYSCWKCNEDRGQGAGWTVSVPESDGRVPETELPAVNETEAVL